MCFLRYNSGSLLERLLFAPTKRMKISAKNALRALKQNWPEKKFPRSEISEYLKIYKNKIIVIKYGGSTIEDKNMLNNFAKNICLIKSLGMNPIVVHGGAPQISKKLRENNLGTVFKDGLRITNKKTLNTVKSILVNQVNPLLCKKIKKYGGRAIGFKEIKNTIITGKPVNLKKYGLVGQPTKINKRKILKLLAQELIPVIAPIGKNKKGQALNNNADTVTGFIANSLSATRFLLLTNVKGVLNKDKKLIEQINTQEAKKLIKNKIIVGGMIPKVKTCIDAVKKNVQGVVILDGLKRGAILIELLTSRGSGTLIKK